MGYLGLNVERSQELANSLRAGAELADQSQALVGDASRLADLPTSCWSLLDAVGVDFMRAARQIDWAVATMTSFQLALRGLADSAMEPAPVRTPEPIVASASSAAFAPIAAVDRWPVLGDAPAGTTWNNVHQEASHNSYAAVGGIELLAGFGVRAFELDIHHQAPVHVRLGRAAGVEGWHVYHLLGWSHSEYQSLQQGLAAVAAIETAEPITVFIDNKDGFGGAHSVEAFDRVLDHELAGRLFSPAELLDRSPGATSLVEAVQRDGWPTVHDLQGRVLVVVTDETEGYDGHDRLAFVAPAPSFSIVAGQIVHDPQADVVFYNANARDITTAELQAIHATNTVVRTYFNPQCAEHFVGEPSVAANYRAVDIALDGSQCEPRVLAPPVPNLG